MKPIQALVVLYRMTVAESPTCQALAAAMQQSPALAAALNLLIADNSPIPQSLPPGFPARYLHDGANPGLARRYNQALAEAQAAGATWLLLFDQDTTPTPAYLEELLSLSVEFVHNPDIAVIVPKLIMDGRILSPHAPRYQPNAYTVTADSSGLIGDSLRAFNSAALMRVSTLIAVGGFPEDYWLDYLDHATMERIQRAGARIYVMHSILQHELSDATPNKPVDPVRLLNRLRAEERFHSQFGGTKENLLHRIDLLRQVIGWGRRGYLAQAMIRLRVLLHLDG